MTSSWVQLVQRNGKSDRWVGMWYSSSSTVSCSVLQIKHLFLTVCKSCTASIIDLRFVCC
uniref:Uncharacterized protein n=1 Tax=Anopheles minimus TaxID=112268 RepID=A0A182WNW4_9DIPT